MLLSSAAVYAAPFTLEFTGIVASSETPGISEGDTITLDLIADNGGSTSLSQTWNLADLQGFTIHAGTFTGTYSQVYPFPSTGNFVTDASGNIISVTFFGTSGSSQNSDNFNASFVGDNVTGGASFEDSLSRDTDIVGGTWNTPSQWSVQGADASAPEPSTIGLFAAGLVGLAALKRKKA